MSPKSQIVWSSIEFRKSAMLREIDPLSHKQMLWTPAVGRNSIAWLLWHITEVEDNWIRDKLLSIPKRYPFGPSVRDAETMDYPTKSNLLGYFQEVRRLTRKRLTELTDNDFAQNVYDEHFGNITVQELWSGVLTSFAWHAGQIVLTKKLLLQSQNQK